MDRSWMDLQNRRNEEYVDDVGRFRQYFEENGTPRNNKYRCPCNKCANMKWLDARNIYIHLLKHGIVKGYTRWIYHGEVNEFRTLDDHIASKRRLDNVASSSAVNQDMDDVHVNPILEYIDDVTPFRAQNDIPPETEGCVDDEVMVDELATRNYSQLMADEDMPLYKGSTERKLSTILELISLKEKNGWSNECVDNHCEHVKNILPKDNVYPEGWKAAKKVLKRVGLTYKTYHACYYGCYLFYRTEDEKLNSCPKCFETRWEFTNGKEKKPVPRKTVKWFPLIPRLQRLFSSTHIAEKMRWHGRKDKRNPDLLRHPADGESWKQFDNKYTEFAKDFRNVRIAVCTDRFTPFGKDCSPYSMWPVVVIPYNLPPSMCMKKEFNILSLLISGPKSPGKCLNILMRPFIDELKLLWTAGVLTWDKFGNEAFMMKAAVSWTISDFPGLGMLGGIQTKGYKSCPICLDELDGSYNNGRISYLEARRELEEDDPIRFDKSLYNGKEDRRNPIVPLSGRDVYAQILANVECYGVQSLNTALSVPNASTRKKVCWTHVSIFWELPYWVDLTVRHALDVMHIEKNVCDNVLGTVLNLPGKTKDDAKARMTWKDWGIKHHLWPTKAKDKYTLPEAPYTVKTCKHSEVLERFASARFPSGYAGNLKSKINIKDTKFYGLKTHDTHVILQRILPVVIRPFVAANVATVLCELANWFQAICAQQLSKSVVLQLKKDIILILCKMESIFPPTFHTIMVHLCKHLPDQILQTGPVHYTWMFPIERQLGEYKRSVHNKRYPEGSIAEAYITLLDRRALKMDHITGQKSFRRLADEYDKVHHPVPFIAAYDYSYCRVADHTKSKRLLIKARVMKELGIELPDPVKPKFMDSSALLLYDKIAEEDQLALLEDILGGKRGPYPRGLGGDKKRLKPSGRPKGSASASSSRKVYTAEEVEGKISDAVATIQQQMAEMKALILALTGSQSQSSPDPDVDPDVDREAAL